MDGRRVYDVVVVGAGPCGSAAARACTEQGLATLVVEEHATIGHPVQCAGLLSCAAFAECGVSGRSVIQQVRGARVVTESGSELVFDAGAPKAVVADRGQLDREMAEAAARAGAEIRLKTAVVGRHDRELVTRGVDGTGRIRSQLVIAADGPRSSIARMLGLERSPVFLAGIQADIVRPMDGRYVELYPDCSPEFFGWAIPAGHHRARVGLCGTQHVNERFMHLLKTAGGDGCLHLVTGTIPLGVMPQTYGGRTLFVGDAAGFAKPTSGGGIYTGVRSAKLAAEVAVRCCDEGDFSNEALRRYERRWKEDFGHELALGFRIFKVRQRFGPAQTDVLVRTLNDPDLIAEIVRHGDMDRPGVLVRRLARNPVLFKQFLSFCGNELKNVIIK
ncbi:MAG: NAD(P)/FAD-dependent oxidoreductase [Methanomicrobiaceae archaeon]|nr:NAD(P)/FAD-dependent oxidoreductase [Methanomicrobiaceae archaeon]